MVMMGGDQLAQDEKEMKHEQQVVVVGAEFCAGKLREEVLHFWQPPFSCRLAHISRAHQTAADHPQPQPLFTLRKPFFHCNTLQLLHTPSSSSSSSHDLPLLFTSRKCFSLRKVTHVYRGEPSGGNGALLFTVRLSSLLQCSTNLDVFLATSSSNTSPSKGDKSRAPDYKVKASCFMNALTIVRGDGNVVATAKQEISLSSCFCFKPNYKITVYPGVDQAFITILVAIQDSIRRKMHGHAGGGP